MLVQPQESSEGRGPQVPWQLRDLGLASAWVLAASILMVIVMGVVFVGEDDVSDDAKMVVALGASLVLEVALLGAAVWFSVRRYSCGWRALGFRRAVRGGWWVPVVVVLAAYFTLGVYLLIVELSGLGKMVPQNTVPEDFFESAVALPLVALLAIAAAPIAEETFFRGFLFPALRMRWGTFWAALASGLVFAALHFSLGSLVPFTIIGMLLAWAYVFSGSLWAPIAAHFLFNAVSFIVGVVAGGGS
ncbi:MAG: CPBP family intramembrane metalloprotease [Dehalococcoidia bacterium]|nr:CPBP family intramembrane metalloprotease [Dehalococcoidia bacterium]